MESLLNTVADFEQSLKKDNTMRISEEEANKVVVRFTESPEPQIKDILARGKASVSLAPVKTYVQQLDKAPIPGISSKIVVPAFASHWGIVVGESRQWLMHLVFVGDTEGEQGTSVVDESLIDFNITTLRKPLEGTKHVGETPYRIEELRTLGEEMIKAFGDYHRVFWNCQTFAKCYLRVITGKEHIPFTEWTSADTSRLFLCAFLVGTPLATTCKLVENARTEKLMERFENIPDILNSRERSERAISAMHNAIVQDPSWGEEIGNLAEDDVDEDGFLNKLIKYLFRRN
jgi:hypothetical protein